MEGHLFRSHWSSWLWLSQQRDHRTALKETFLNVIEVEKPMKAVSNPGNLCHIHLISSVLSIRIQPLIIRLYVFSHKLSSLCKGMEQMLPLNEPLPFSSLLQVFFLKYFEFFPLILWCFMMYSTKCMLFHRWKTWHSQGKKKARFWPFLTALTTV